jgi:hypothetical protein
MQRDGWLPRLKSLYWVGSSKRDLSALPDPVIDLFGFALYLAQTGGKHEQAKPVGSKYSSGAAVISKQAAKAFSTADVSASRKRSWGGEEQGVSFALMVAFRMKMGYELGHGSVE